MSAVIPWLADAPCAVLPEQGVGEARTLLRMPSGSVAELAARAAILEAAASPKPGLVCIDGNGAHSDMDYPLFVRSAKALRPYFAAAHALGSALRGAAPQQVFARLRPLGIQAEQCMLRATGGVNTHKGLIFSMGLFCAAVGRLNGQAASAAEIRREAAALARGLVHKDFAPLALARKCLPGTVAADAAPSAARPALEKRLQRRLTAGEVMYLLYGVTGIRGEAEQGFRHVGLALRALAAHGAARDLNTAMAHCLLELMQSMDDTNILWRGGPQGLHYAAAASRAALAAGGLHTAAGSAALRRMSADFARRRLSPGGCADILAVSVFLRLLRCHGGR